MARKTMQQRFSDAFDRAEESPRMAMNREATPRMSMNRTVSRIPREGLEEIADEQMTRMLKKKKN